ncbi:hypothetical protein CAEBREN_07135 [Caenorhabditis brenneri]|uniref:Uncharacterized protein n=1 Tax=Caenorhabditis brenneri TaxID=135651 RepID=G0M8A1_CAEBE|nr:hypothetical protein CAEBREN_07135 [Caenorhabditis brenneri]
MKIHWLVLALVANAIMAGGAKFRHEKFHSPPVKSPEKDAHAEKIRKLIKPSNIRDNLRELTKTGHVAGTEKNLRVAKWIRQKTIEYGLENVHFNEYDVLLSYPDWKRPNHIEILDSNGTVIHKSTGRSKPLTKEETDEETELQWLAYSAEGAVQGDVVYINKATPEDIAHGKIVIARYSHSFRGNIAKAAVQAGAIGCLIYSDPQQVAILGTGPEATYGKTDKMPPDAVQRGTIYIGVGDPRTPAFPSIKGLYKEKTEEDLLNEKAIPTIPVLPIPYSEAKIIFERMNGKPVIPGFQGGLNVTYKYGPGFTNNQKLKLSVCSKKEERKIQNVLGFIRGKEEPDRYVLATNHYDAWTYGAVDPNSGTATLMEVSRAMMEYMNKTGYRPAKSILFGHWDAEEFGLVGSGEFAEEYREQLMSRAIGVVNMDLIGGNQTLLGITNPTVANVLRSAARKVEHPNPSEVQEGRKTMYDSWKFYSPSKNNRSNEPWQMIPAGGSDHLPFYNYLGIPIIFFVTRSLDTFPSYPLYHTMHETPHLMENILDADFKMHKAIGEMFVESILAFTDSKLLPYDLKELLDDVTLEFLPAIRARFETAMKDKKLMKYLEPGYEQFGLLEKTCQLLNEQVHMRNESLLSQSSAARLKVENDRLMELEKCFIKPDGILGNRQSRHLLFSPSQENWYSGNAMSQVHDLLTRIEKSKNDKKMDKLSKALAGEIGHIHVAFICAKHSLSPFFAS